MLLRFGLLFCCLAMLACRSELETIETKDELGYKIKYVRNKKDFGKQGLYQSFYPSGKLYEEAMYESDTLNGPRKLYYESGQLEILENYQNGAFVGDYQKWFESGQLQLEGHYDDNKASGEWKRYYDNGQLMEVVLLKDNEERGPFTEYHRNGKLKAEGTYAGVDIDTGNPMEQGELKLYNESGTLIKTMDCNLGRCRTTWQLEDQDE